MSPLCKTNVVYAALIIWRTEPTT